MPLFVSLRRICLTIVSLSTVVDSASASNVKTIFNCLNKCSVNSVHSTELTFLTEDPMQSESSFPIHGYAVSVSHANAPCNWQLPSFSSLLISDITTKNISKQEELIAATFNIFKSNRHRVLIFVTEQMYPESNINFMKVKKHFNKIVFYVATVQSQDECNMQLDLLLLSGVPSNLEISIKKIDSITYGDENFCEHFISLRLLSSKTNLANLEIRASAVGAIDSILEHLIKDDGKGNLKFVSGFSVKLLNDLMDMLKFRIKAFIGEWIRPGKNNTLIGNSTLMLLNGELDIHISHTIPLPYRAVHLDFLQPTILGGIAVFLTQPEVSYFRDVYVTPFTKQVWIAVFVTTFALALTMQIGNLIIARNSTGLWPGSDDEGCGVPKVIEETFMWSFSVFSQGWFMSPESFSLRIILLTGVLFGLLCYTAYSAAIVAILSTDLNPISSLSQLISSNVPLFADSNSTTITSLVEELVKDKDMHMRPVTSVMRDDGVFTLLNLHPSAIFTLTLFFYRSLRFYNVTEQWMCKFMSDIPVNMAPTINCMVIPKNSALKELFNYKVMWLKEIGLNYRYLQAYDSSMDVACTKTNNVQKNPLGFSDLVTAYNLLGGGFLLCFGQFIAEKLIFSLCNREKTICTSQHKMH